MIRIPLTEVIAHQRQTNQIELLPVYYEHILELDNLPLHHKDPFDRLLLAQARLEGMVIVSKDPQFHDYAGPSNGIKQTSKTPFTPL